MTGPKPLLWAAVLLSCCAAGALAACGAPASSLVGQENCLPGAGASWRHNVDSSIVGFSDDISYEPGSAVSFKIKVATGKAFASLSVLRLGWYNGDGARVVTTAPVTATGTATQLACAFNSTTGLEDCGNWATTATWTIPANAVSGLYLAQLQTTGNLYNYVPFIVRQRASDTAPSAILFQTSDTTWQAYNFYGASGNSLYRGTGPGNGASSGRAYKVSYNRPFITQSGDSVSNSVTGPQDFLFNAEYPMIRWLERNGYDVSYFSGVDSDRYGSQILLHKVFISVGHDEYWSGGQRRAVEAARNTGVHLAFFSGNTVFWKTRWEADLNNKSYRTLVCYKETHENAKIDPLPTVWTGTWRDNRPFVPSGPDGGNQPENTLTGLIFLVTGGTVDLQVRGLYRLVYNISLLIEKSRSMLYRA
eukprot:SM000064S19735  [mRNA]  locus=s64:87939:90944:- [translate_table: standard]